MATMEIPPKFLLAHSLKRSNLVRSLLSVFSSTMFCVSSDSGRWLVCRRISSAFNAATSAIASYRSFFLGSDCFSASSLQWVSSVFSPLILLSVVIPPSLCCSMVGIFTSSIPRNSLSSFSVSSLAIAPVLGDFSFQSLE